MKKSDLKFIVGNLQQINFKQKRLSFNNLGVKSEVVFCCNIINMSISSRKINLGDIRMTSAPIEAIKQRMYIHTTKEIMKSMIVGNELKIDNFIGKYPIPLTDPEKKIYDEVIKELFGQTN